MKVTRKIGISFSVQSTRDTPCTEKYFTPVACILVFNLSDLSGRILATYLQWPGRSSRGQWTFFAIVLLRLSLIPICMLCNAAPTARKLPGLNTKLNPFFYFPFCFTSEVVSGEYNCPDPGPPFSQALLALILSQIKKSFRTRLRPRSD